MKLNNNIISLISRIRGKANQFIVEELEKENIRGLSPSHGNILMMLFKYGELPMNKLSELIGRKKNTLTVLIDKLLKESYVEKRTDGNDSRVSIISLTEKGKSLEPLVIRISENLITKVYSGISDRDREITMNTLKKIDGNLG